MNEQGTKVTIIGHDIVENGKVITGHYKIVEWGFIFSSKEIAEEYANTHIERNGMIEKIQFFHALISLLNGIRAWVYYKFNNSVYP